MNNIIILNNNDNVAVALNNIAKGSAILANGRSIEVKQDIGAGFKISLTNIATSEKVIKFGHAIGMAKIDIKEGEKVHVENMSSTI